MHEPNPAFATDRAPDLFGPLLSTAIFGYYGFLAGLNTTDGAGVSIGLWLGTLWILRAAAVLFLLSALLALRGDRRTNLLYGGAGLIATAGLAAILVWDQIDTNYSLVFSPILLVLFIAWNGYGSIMTLRDALR